MFVFERRMREGGWEKSRKVTDTHGKESENVCVEDDNSEAKSSRAQLSLIAILMVSSCRRNRNLIRSFEVDNDNEAIRISIWIYKTNDSNMT